jgi:hypothetical protein
MRGTWWIRTKARSSNAEAILAEAGNLANERKAKWTNAGQDENHSGH